MTPTKLSEITLRKWVEFYHQYGREHETRWNEIEAMPDGQEKADARMLLDIDQALQTYSFYSGVPVEELSDKVKEVYIEQGTAFISLKQEESALTYSGVYEWRGEKWAIQPLYTGTGKMTYAQFQISQDLALILSDFQDGKIEAIYYLCAAYFRKVGEAYTSDFGSLGNERAVLMEQLPLNYAMRVKKYTEDSINIYKQSK